MNTHSLAALAIFVAVHGGLLADISVLERVSFVVKEGIVYKDE